MCDSPSPFPAKDLRLHNVLGVSLAPINKESEGEQYFKQLQESWLQNVSGEFNLSITEVPSGK